MIITDMRNLDVVRANLFEPIIIAEDDENAHRLLAQLVVNGELLKVPSGYEVSFQYCRADGAKGVIAGLITSDGKISVDIPTVMIELDDLVKCDVCVNYRENVTIHELSVQDRDLVAVPLETETDMPLRTGLFYIDSQYRVIIPT